MRGIRVLKALKTIYVALILSLRLEFNIIFQLQSNHDTFYCSLLIKEYSLWLLSNNHLDLY